MGRRSKSDELGLGQRIVDMHDTEKMTHSEISEQLKDEGMDVSREAVRRSYLNSMKQAGRYRMAAESCRQIIDMVKDGSNLDMIEAINSIITGKLYDQIMAMDDFGLDDPKAVVKAITSAGSTQVKIAQFRLNFDKGVQKAKSVIYDELAEKLSDMPEVLDVIAKVISEAKVTE